MRRFELRVAIAALGASATAISVSRVLLGDAADFQVGALALAPQRGRSTLSSGRSPGSWRLCIIACCLELLIRSVELDRWPVELHAGLIGAAVGMLAWLAPDLVGGGDAITQRALFGVDTLAVLPLVFLLRLGLGAISYAAGTPGGCLPPCSYWAPNWDCSSGSSASSYVRI